MLIQAVIGVVVVLAMHLKNGWWLDAGDRVREMLIVLGAVAVIVSLWKARMPAYKRVMALWAGFMVGATVILFASGGSNLFPIVLAFAAGLSAAAVAPGAIIGTVREKFSR